MLKDKIENLLNNQSRDVMTSFFDSEFAESFYSWEHQDIKNFRNLLNSENITFKHITNHGGEDEGSDFWSVYSFTDGTDIVFIKFEGWYASYAGSTYHSFFEVKPVEKMAVFYEKK